MRKQVFQVGDSVQIVDPDRYRPVMSGRVLEVNDHPFDYDSLLVEIQGASLESPKIWASSRQCSKVG